MESEQKSRFFVHIILTRCLTERTRTIVNLISNTKTQKGLKINSDIDDTQYEKGIKVGDDVMAQLNIERASFHGEWNYKIKPQEVMHIA
jgi:hypothetical protein